MEQGGELGTVVLRGRRWEFWCGDPGDLEV